MSRSEIKAGFWGTNYNNMTTDKIKHYIGEYLFNYWGNVQDKNVLNNAKIQLKKELNEGLLSGIKYQAELKYLEYLTR